MIGSCYNRDGFSEISPQGWMEQDTVKYIECMILLYSKKQQKQTVQMTHGARSQESAFGERKVSGRETWEGGLSGCCSLSGL